MKKDQYTLEQVWIDLQTTPSYFERFTTEVEIEGQQPLSNDWSFCLSCGNFVADESHECRKEVA